ncbi:uncharacterized protein [Nicotiana tomentosiformis]|uniref:uncharacterized protein n=1 Tax=Nicotiana tomentosiformis TaxID=4098 RepID=UPI00388C451D
MKKTPEKIVTILDELSEDANQWPSESAERRRATGVHQVDANTSLQRQQFQPQQSNQPGLEDLMKAFIVKTDERLDAHGAAIKELGTGFRNLERQVGQIATILSERIPGTLPTDTERNPKETVNVVTLRTKNKVDKKKKGKKGTEKRKKEENSRREESEESKHMHALPFPQKLYREKLDKQFERFLDMLKQVNVNLSFTEVIFQMPAYAKFLKEILTNKRKIEETSVKLEDEIGEIRSAPICLQLADQTTLIPEGIVEDVVVRVDKSVFPVDFIVVNMEENKEVPLILGRPFLATSRAILDIHDRKRMLRVGEETITLR